jgi:hypothetical protein
MCWQQLHPVKMFLIAVLAAAAEQPAGCMTGA